MKKLKFASNKAAKINGLIDKSRLVTAAIAIVVVIIAGALLLKTLLIGIVIKKMDPMII